ncbi:MAG: arginine--tRNA ligase [Actinomycetota bacterium]
MITDELEHLVATALEAAAADGIVEAPPLGAIAFERPRRREHGDWATNIALVAAKSGGSPRPIAEAILARLPPSDLVDEVEVAGPGFLNFRLSPRWLQDVVRRAARPGSGFGRTASGAGTRINVEYVSANPTGPINVVSGRQAAVGDAIANLLEAAGHEVTREFFVNDAGLQATLFARSVAARYLEQLGREGEIPPEGYHGDYVSELAQAIVAEHGERWLDATDEDREQAMRSLALPHMLEQMKSSLERFGTVFDIWFSESELHRSGAVDESVDALRAKGFIDDRDGAAWFRSSALGDDKDRVIVRSNGEPTYLAGDTAYLADKFGRGFEHLVYLWGPDHHGTIPRLLAAAEALGFDRSRVEVQLVQVVTLTRGGEAVKASKRAGMIVPLDELVSEVGKDAARYTFLTRSLDTHLEFDLELAKVQAPENPVYYVQYAHARICSILRRAAESGVEPDAAAAPLDRLEHPSEVELMRMVASFEEVVPDAAGLRAPQRLARYVEELASTFTGFYRDCRVVSDDVDLTQARLALCLAARGVIADGLAMLGVSAPEKM